MNVNECKMKIGIISVCIFPEIIAVINHIDRNNISRDILGLIHTSKFIPNQCVTISRI